MWIIQNKKRNSPSPGNVISEDLSAVNDLIMDCDKDNSLHPEVDLQH